MKVLHIVPSLEMGGMERMVADLACATKARGWQVEVVCTSTDGAIASSLREQGVTVAVVPPQGAAPWFGGGALYRVIRDLAPNVVHSHSGAWWRTVAAAARAGVPARVHTVHGLHAKEPWWGPIEKWAASTVTDVAVCVAPSLCEYLTAVCRVPARKVHSVPNGVDVHRFRAARDRVRADANQADGGLITVGVVARLAAIKNLPLLLTAVARCRSRGVPLRLVVVGDGPERDQLERLAGELSLGGFVRFVGEVADPAPVLAELDIFVLPSISEGMSIALLEAMASGCACIATAVGGSPTVLDDGRAGILVPSDDVEALVKALSSLAGDGEARARLIAAARERVETEYGVGAMADRYLALYRALL